MPANYNVRVTQTAQSDLEEIWDYIAADSLSNAAAFVRDLENTLETLEQFPERCALIPENELLETNYRHFILQNYRILFRLEGLTVFILRIVHGARLLDSSFFD